MRRLLPLLLLLVACTGRPDPTPRPPADCTRTPGDFRCHVAYSARSVPLDRGLQWREDPTFLLADHTVPSFVHLADGTHLMVSTSRSRRGTLALHRSTDGRTWTPVGRVPTEKLPERCGRVFLDATAQYLAGGRVRLLVEGWRSPTGQAQPGASGPPAPGDDPGTRLCALQTTDGRTWTVESGAPLLPTDGSMWPSVPAVLQHDLESDVQLYFADTFPGRDGIRTARLAADHTFTPGGPTPLLPERHVDPEPTHVRATRSVRLYHTWDALSGELGVADSHDGGATFDAVQKLEGLSGQVCHTPPEQPSPPDLCRLDPAFLALSDGTLMLYYSRFQTTADGRDHIGIGRAIAID